MDVISRQEAIEPKAISEWKKEFREYVDSLDITRDDWKGIIEYIDEIPSAQPIDVQEAYYRGKIDGIKECRTMLKKMNEEFANGRHNLQTGGTGCAEPTSGHNTRCKQQHHGNDTP